MLGHHKDENKLNNDIDNLEIKTRSEHTTLHNNSKEIIRDSFGKIIGVVKKGEFSESLAEDNTEPSVTNEHNSSNEGAEHSSWIVQLIILPRAPFPVESGDDICRATDMTNKTVDVRDKKLLR